MISHDITADNAMEIQPAAPQIYMACSFEDLIAVEMDAWNQGYERAAVDDARVLREMAQVGRAAEVACEAALLSYVPMDLSRFRDVFVRAWCGGYCTRRHEHERRLQQPISRPGREDSQAR